MQIEFNPAKSKSNEKKHGVSFAEAATALLDPMALVKENPDEEDRIRLISARKATREEAKNYA